MPNIPAMFAALPLGQYVPLRTTSGAGKIPLESMSDKTVRNFERMYREWSVHHPIASYSIADLLC
uniref:Integrase n=1 Tax=Steinernema glaseri TaxID=37863 RepID=A0A1I7Z6G1_9BILA